MIHDFSITENYVIIPDLPMETRFDIVTKEGGCPFRYNQEVPSYIGIMKKLNQNPDQVQWFELPNHYTFHYVNSWEEKNKDGNDNIILWGCTGTEVKIELETEHPFVGE